MANARRVREMLVAEASANFIGRRSELAALLDCVTGRRPIVTWIHGIAGIGKSALLSEFCNRAGSAGASAVRLDCRFVEPTAEGFCAELARLLGSTSATPDAVADALGHSGGLTVLVIDSYEVFLLLESWMRETFVPLLCESVRVVVSSRHPPGSSWTSPLEWQGLFRSIHLPPLSDPEALELLARAGIQGPDAERLNRFAQGHPLALRLALSVAAGRSPSALEAGTLQVVVQHLSRLYLAGVTDPINRKVIEAASVVRRATQSLLEAMLPRTAPDLQERLAASSFVEITPDGLVLNGAVRDAVSSSLRATDPHRFQSYRRAAWHQLRSEAPTATWQQRWSYTADMIFLLQNAIVRDAFFPANSQQVSVERVRPADGEAIRRIAVTHETPGAARIVERWWDYAPDSFRAVRDSSGALTGFYILVEMGTKSVPPVEHDPLARSWQRHLRDHPLPKDQTAVYLRRWLSAAHGELPSPVQAACWLDAKRSYIELRPHLRRCYLSLCDLTTYGPTAQRLGFQVVDGAACAIDGVSHHLAVLDFGPSSVDGWLCRLVAGELGLDENGSLDMDSRQLVLEGKRIALTALEFEMVRYLQARQGKVVSRAELLEQVWRCRPDSASNVVDVVVRSVRSKMGRDLLRIVTVRGTGYRWNPH